MRAIRINTDDTITITITITITDGPDRLTERQHAVGGHIEVVNLADGLDLIADEEGLITRRPLDYYGTLIPRLFDIPVQGIVGNVLLVGNRREDFTDAPDAPDDAYDVLDTLGHHLDRS